MAVGTWPENLTNDQLVTEYRAHAREADRWPIALPMLWAELKRRRIPPPY